MAKKRRSTGGAGIYILVVVAVMVIATIVSLGVFFKISEIYVTGARMYTPGEVATASEIRVDESIFFINDSAVAAKIKDQLHYVDDVRIIKTLPGTITIEITESFPVAAVAFEGKLYVVDKNTKILEETTTDRLQYYIELRGIVPIMPKVGDKLALGAENAVKLQYLKDTLAGIMKAEIYADVSWIDFTNISAVTFRYQDRFTVDLGRGDKIDDKLWLLNKIAEQHPKPQKARIDLSDPNEGHYIGQ